MAIYSMYFSPTGGTKKCADAVMHGLCGANTYSEINLCNLHTDYTNYTFAAEDVALVAVPVYEGTVPTLAAERLAQMQGGGCKAILMAVWGNRAFDDAFTCLADVVQKAGFTVVGAVSAVAEHSVVRSIAKGRPDAQDVEELQNFGKQLAESLQTPHTSALTLPGKADYTKPKRMGLTPATSAKCTNCGLCAKECPAGAIDAENGRKIDSEKCISCLRCIQVCPVGAKAVPPMILAGATAMLKIKASGHKENALYL